MTGSTTNDGIREYRAEERIDLYDAFFKAINRIDAMEICSSRFPIGLSSFGLLDNADGLGIVIRGETDFVFVGKLSDAYQILDHNFALGERRQIDFDLSGDVLRHSSELFFSAHPGRIRVNQRQLEGLGFKQDRSAEYAEVLKGLTSLALK